MLNFLTVALVVLPLYLGALIIEGDSLQKCLEHHEAETWVICDIDNTLIESCQQLGTVQWAEHLIKRLKEAGMPPAKVVEIESRAWRDVQQSIAVRLVRSDTALWLCQLQKRGAKVMALTARDSEEQKETEEQLKSCGIDFSQAPPYLQPFERAVGQKRVLYDKGILYATNTLKKSEALCCLLKICSQKPKKIIFIDDKLHHVQDLENMARHLGIAFVGIRFNAADERVRIYNPDVAKLQWQMLPHFLSDDEAAARLLAINE